MKLINFPGKEDEVQTVIDHLIEQKQAGKLKKILVIYEDDQNMVMMSYGACSTHDLVWMHRMWDGFLDRMLDPDGHGM